ncbi:MAG: hypothetical protein PW843_14580 [Azospirillaceae bacterium]|nr:hypothetical protein [Azospirillaceae bacterium]
MSIKDSGDLDAIERLKLSDQAQALAQRLDMEAARLKWGTDLAGRIASTIKSDGAISEPKAEGSPKPPPEQTIPTSSSFENMVDARKSLQAHREFLDDKMRRELGQGKPAPKDKIE